MLENDAPTTARPAAPKPPAKSRAKAITLAALSLGFAVVQLDVTIVNTALDSIGTSLGGGVTELQWVVNAYTIAFAALILTAGALGDRIGAKNVFIAGFGIFTAASLACALAPNAATLIVARAVQGVGAAVLVPNSLALLNHAYPDETERGRAIGIWAGGASIALTAGPLAGGALIALVGWRSIFLVNLPIGAVGLWLAWRYADETEAAADRELDLAGQLLAIGALGCLAAAMIEAGAIGWSNAAVIAGFVTSIVLAALFVLREGRTPQPMLPLSLFRHRLFSAAAIVGLLINVAFYGFIFVLSLYFQRVDGFSPFETGLAFLPMLGIVLPVNLMAPRLAERIGAPATIAAGAVLGAAGCVAMLFLDVGTNYGLLCVQLCAFGAGLALIVPPMTSTLLGSVEKARSGVAAGVLNATRQTGSVIGVALFGSLVAKADSFIPGARASLMISATLLLAAAITILASGRRKKSNSA